MSITQIFKNHSLHLFLLVCTLEYLLLHYPLYLAEGFKKSNFKSKLFSFLKLNGSIFFFKNPLRKWEPKVNQKIPKSLKMSFHGMQLLHIADQIRVSEF